MPEKSAVLAVLLLVTVFTQALFALVRRNLVTFPFSSARHKSVFILISKKNVVLSIFFSVADLLVLIGSGCICRAQEFGHEAMQSALCRIE